MKLESYWNDGVARFAGATEPLTSNVDVAIVGGGFCGLSAALALARRGASVVLLQTPEYRSPAHPEDPAHFARLAARYRVPFLDYNQALRSPFNDDAANFFDWHHLSGVGAKAFSKRLSRDLARLDLPGWRAKAL